MAMSMFKRYSMGFTRANTAPTPKPAVNEPHPSKDFFKQDSFSKKWSFTIIKSFTVPTDESSHDDTVQIIEANDAADHASCIEKDTTAAKQKARKAHMATKSRVQSLRNFFGMPSPAFNALEDSEKEEYQTWLAYARQEKEMRLRYEEIAEDPADVEVMLRGWRVDHPPPRLSVPVLALVAEESVVHKSGIHQSGDTELPPLSQDVIWNAITLIPFPSSSIHCQICGQGPVTFLGLRTMYTLPCRHYLHVKCFEEDSERWLGRSVWGAAGEGARECIRCKGLKELTRVLPRAGLDARIRRVGDELFDSRKNKQSGTASVDTGGTELGDRPG